MSRLAWTMGIILSGCAAVASAAPGDLDPTFGGTGVVTANVAADQGRGLALDGAGNIVVGGYVGSFVNGSFLLARFDDVGVGGVLATTNFPDNPGEGDNAQAVLVDGSGRIVLVGSVNGRGSNAEIGLARYLANGALDASFDTDGRFEFNVGSDDRAFDAALDGTGRIVLVGSSDGAALVARVTDAGALDATFDGDGIASVAGSTAQAVAIDGSGRILVASDNGNNIFVSRYTTAGALDGTFGAGGTATIDLGGTERAFALAVDGTDRIIVAGSAGVGSASSFLVSRLTSAGVLDATFNTTGSNQVSVSTGADIAFGVDLSSDGGIVAGGSAGGDTGVVRLLDDGTLDVLFGTAGIVLLDQQAGSLDAGFDLLVDTQDRIVVAGRIFTSVGNGNDLSVARLEGGGSTADLSITKTNGVATSIPGTDSVYTITASNAGPSDAIGATVADTFPAACDVVNWTCVGAGGGTCTAAGTGSINDTVDLPSGASVTYTATCTINAAATGNLVNTATITEPAGTTDPDPANNSATDTDTLTPTADLAITKTNGVASSIPGTNTVYTIVASNTGPSNAPGSTVADTFPAACTSVNWTCAGAAGGTCTAAGSGNINDVVNLPAGGSVTFTATCAIDPAAVGSLVNTATVATSVDVTDPTPANNSATDTDALGASADVSVAKVAVGVPDPLLIGSAFSYTLTAANAGPSVATGVVVSDTLPATLNYVSNDCGAAFAAPTLTWNIGNLAPGAAPVCNLNVTVAALGQIVNTASVSSTSTDPVPANDASTVTLVGAQPADVAISLTSSAGLGTLAVGDTYTYTVTGTNNGPGVAVTLDFSLELASKVSFVSSTCGATLTGNTLNWTVATLASGASTDCVITVVVVLGGEIQALANVSTISVDPVLENNSATLAVATGAIAVPALGWMGLSLLLILVAAMGTIIVRRHG